MASSLSLARAGSNTVGLGSSRGGLSIGAGEGRGVGEVGERSLAHATQRLARGLLAILLVSGGIERDEEDQVRAQDTDARESGKLLASALARVGHPGEVN